MPKSPPTEDHRDARRTADEFVELARGPQPSALRAALEYLRDNKKWWLTPIVVVFLVLAGLVFVASSSAAPFVYTLF